MDLATPAAPRPPISPPTQRHHIDFVCVDEQKKKKKEDERRPRQRRCQPGR